eukprot:CAMPEP_0201883460 /NCGR_PEP_ID=MMETSP0902-20130614/15746_1 /ASSEMBLY_ACC=CAM_ASM_000551 /TAXON_ID=420261 /ORGANISM="Thalassiosira antarctica, Strain CCMP982" /LENGTH=61 /DNA_ID=CAMNT_0048412267 /DNA_START=509 /DNA_END=694 /DNA_ORIENTATION=-
MINQLERITAEDRLILERQNNQRGNRSCGETLWGIALDFSRAGEGLGEGIANLQMMENRNR